MGYSGFALFSLVSLACTIVSAAAAVFVAVGLARIAGVLQSMNITTMDAVETAKRIEKAQLQNR